MLLFSVSGLYAQDLRMEPFYPTNSALQKELEKKRIHSGIQKYWEAPAYFDKEGKQIFETECAQLENELGEIIDKKALFDDVLVPYVKAVHAKIIAANPGLPATNVVVVAEAIPNAFSTGEGSLMVYTGLLAALENEAQLNFVLCHEIAHFVLQHGKKQITQNIARIQSKELKDELKKVQAAQYNQADLFESLLQKVQFRSRYHNRVFELQADSLAYQLFIKTDADPNQAQRLMQVFQHIDEPLKDTLLSLERHFGCSHYPYKKSWENQKPVSTWANAIAKRDATQQPLADSMKTHPDALLRLKCLDTLAKTTQHQTKAFSPNENASIKCLGAIESVEAAYRDADYDWAIYLALLYQKAYPNCAYFKDVFALSLKELYINSKNHTLSEVLAQSSFYHSSRYNSLLALLNNLSLSDLLLIQGCLQGEISTNTEHGLYAKYTYAQISGDTQASQNAKKEYLQKYPHGRFKPKLAEND